MKTPRFRGKQHKRLAGDAFWALFGQGVSAIALLVGTRILTEQVTPAIYGQVALLNGFVALGVAVFSYPFICAGMRLLPECRSGGDRDALHRVVTRLSARSTALAIALLMIGSAVYRHLTHTEMGLFMLAGILLAVTVRRELGIQLLIGERKQRGASLRQTCDSILRPLFAILLVGWGGAKAEWVLLGYILASGVASMTWKPKADNNPSIIVARRFRPDLWAYALPLIPMELLFWVNGLADRYVIGYMLTAAEVGLYAATYTLVNEAFNRSAMVLLRIFQPVYFQYCSQQRFKEGFRILWVWIACVIALGLVGVALLLVMKDWVVAWLLAKSYHSAVALMPAIAVGCALHALGTVVAQPLLAKKRTRRLLFGRICGAVTAAISLPLLVKDFGLAGAAIANPIYFGVEALVLALLARPWRPIGSEKEASGPAEEDTAGCRVTV